MTKGVFYCYQIPRCNLARLDWIVENPIRDWELEVEVGQPVWRVEYNPNHPSMQKFNRLTTCTACQFLGVVFDDDVEDDLEEEWQEATLVWH
jgi:hypothetical protein